MRDWSRFYEHCEIYKNDELDYMTNSQYKTYKAEPNYTLLVALYRHLPKDALRLIIQYNSHKLDLSNRTIRRLINSIEKCSFHKFKFIYDLEYIDNPNIINFFEFDEFALSPGSVWIMYELCNCRTCCYGNDYCNECMPERLRKYYSIKECCCQNGKRFIAYNMIDNYIKESITTSAEAYAKTNKIKTNELDETTQKNVLREMINHIIESGPININYNSVVLVDYEI
jgi:hypothetical protein